MRIFIPAFFFLLAVLSPSKINAQFPDPNITRALELLNERAEVCLEFERPPHIDMQTLSDRISVDALKGNTVRAYANHQEFQKFLELGLSYRVLEPETMKESSLKSSASWAGYPLWSEYLSMMQSFADDYPEICRLVKIGESVDGRDLLFVKISDAVQQTEPEPVVLYTSTMHGNETVGFVLLLRFVDTLLRSYGNDPRLTSLVDSLEIWINPISNPDGAYRSGDAITSPVRYNANGKDLNRNFPDPKAGENPGGPYQPETLAMMAFMDTLRVCISANFHGGYEIVNYPWDTWYPGPPDNRPHPDKAWFEYISHEYADTAHYYSPAGYMDPQDPWADKGITNGAEWYPITGGRQDYVTYFLRGREVTIEISNPKTPDPSTLPLYWEYNYRSLLNYLEQAMFGVQGRVTDSITGEPLVAKVEIPEHDTDSSHICSDNRFGFYTRLLHEGTYDLRFSAPGYRTKTIPGVNVTNRKKTRLDVRLRPDTSGLNEASWPNIRVWPNPAVEFVNAKIVLQRSGQVHVSLISLTGEKVFFRQVEKCPSGESTLQLPMTDITPGAYILRVHTPDGIFTSKIFRVSE